MNDILKITASLTGICVAAALILGGVFAKTDAARKDIERQEKDHTIQNLLGFGHGHTPPADLKVHQVHRYVIDQPDGTKVLGYVLPTKEGTYVLATIDLMGKPQKVVPLQADAAKMLEEGSRTQAVVAALPGSRATYAETFFVANKGSERLAYVLPGVTQGFKTYIQLMVSVDPALTVTGVAVIKSEEDPGLGDEIKKDFFKNQFKGKTKDALKELKVIKEPLPEEYRDALEPDRIKKKNLSGEKVTEIKSKHIKDDIYALTGATISSRALTRGVVETVTKFAYRLAILDKAIKQDNIPVSF
ncbi:MAG: FMN-binding protein [Thermodesulfobacteriota bacterium]